MTNAPTSGTRCCGDDSPDNSYYYSANPTTATSLTCERCNAGSYVAPIAYYGNGYYAGSLTTSTTTKCYYGDITCSAASGANGTNANIYGNGWANASVTAAPVILCYYGDMGCGDGTYSNGTSGIYYGNGYMPGSSTSRVCYYGDISCSDGSATNGTTQTVYGWGHYEGSLTTSTSVSCKSGAATCTDGSAANDSSTTLYGNGYMPGSGTTRTCYYGDITCASGSEANGTSATVYGWGWYSGSLTTSATVTCRRPAGTCSDGSSANGSASTLCGNGYFSSSGSSCSSADQNTATSGYCYYGDMACSDVSEANGAVSGLLYGNGYTIGTPAADVTGTCYYGNIACSDGSSGNGTNATVHGNGYESGGACYYGDWACGDGTYANGSSCALACGGSGNACCTSQSIYTDSVSCSVSACGQTDHDRDSAQSYCTATASGCTAYDWSIGGEINATACCGDDAGENKRLRFCSSWCVSNASDDACCGASNKCVYNDACYGSGSCYSDDAYCDAGAWHDSDDGQTYCEACSGSGRWNAGGEVSPTLCCGDEAGENYDYRLADGGMDNSFATNSSDDACCSAANDCVANSACYSSGSTANDIDSDGDNDYCNAGTWYDCSTAAQCPSGYSCFGGDCVDVIDLMYVIPTPAHGSKTPNSSVTINLTANDTVSMSIDTCTLQWNGVNETMTKSGSETYANCYATKAVADGSSYSFRAYVNDSAGNLEMENERNFSVNTAPSLPGVYLNVSFTKNGDHVLVATTGANDSDGDEYYLRCGNATGLSNLCNSSQGSEQRNCSFASGWNDNVQHIVYCRLDDGYEYSAEAQANLTADNLPPTPNPAQIETAIVVSTSMTVTAAAASDASAGLNAFAYRFNDSGTWSEWQAGRTYTNSSLQPNTLYCFNAQYRDALNNTGSASSQVCNYTLADQPSVTSVSCSYNGTHACQANFSMGSNPYGVEYYIDETTGSAGGSDKNWTAWAGETSYNDVVSLPHTSYCYRIAAKNQNGTSTPFSSQVCGTSYNNVPSVTRPVVYDNTMTERTYIKAGRDMYVKVNVSDGDGAGDINSVKIKITDNNDQTRVDSADMANIASITNGYTYQYSYRTPSDGEGTWTIEITCVDDGSAQTTNSTTFAVLSLRLGIRLVLNETAANIYVPGEGERAFADLTNAYYPSPEHYYIASYKNASLNGLVFQDRNAFGVFTNKTADTFSVGLDLKYPNSVVFLVHSKGDWKAVNSRIGIIENGAFADYSEPTFAFGLGDKQKMKILLQYENLDILGGRRDVGRGATSLSIKHEGLFGQDVGLNITRPP